MTIAAIYGCLMVGSFWIANYLYFRREGKLSFGSVLGLNNKIWGYLDSSFRQQGFRAFRDPVVALWTLSLVLFIYLFVAGFTRAIVDHADL